jgi:transposase
VGRLGRVLRIGWGGVTDDSGVVGRGELTDRAWDRIGPLLPPTGGRGGRWRDHRQVINAILWKLRTGAPWRDLPQRYGPWKTAHERLRKWTADGTWDRILDEVIVKDDSVGQVEWIVSVDSSVVRAHQHAAGARKKGDVRPAGSKHSRSTAKRSAGPVVV